MTATTPDEYALNGDSAANSPGLGASLQFRGDPGARSERPGPVAQTRERPVHISPNGKVS